jgi:hypothetical protein
MPFETARQSSSQSRGKRTVTSAPPMRLICGQMPGVAPGPFRLQRTTKLCRSVISCASGGCA